MYIKEELKIFKIEQHRKNLRDSVFEIDSLKLYDKEQQTIRKIEKELKRV